jgi:large subunit ribosomal protein L5
MARLHDQYREVVRDELKDRFGYTNPMQIPKLDKIVIKMGVGEAVADQKKLQSAVSELALISGQKPAVCRARKSVANFKLREGMPIGCKVTLRGERMWEFLDRLTSIALPRIRDFRGISPRSFDRQGNYSLGLQEQIIFPEIDYDEIDQTRGLDVVFTISGGNPAHSKALLDKFGMPFRKQGQQA